MRLLIACFLLTGCDALLRLQEPSGSSANDEDGDGIPDDTDLCPADALTPLDADADGDGVGDACDPNNSMLSLTRFVMFEPFYAPPDGWSGGAFAFANSAATNTVFDGMITHAITAHRSWLAETYVETDGMTNASNPYVELLVTDPTTGNQYGCSVELSAGSATLTFVGASGSTSFAGSGRLRIVLVGNFTEMTCQAGFAGQSMSMLTGSGIATFGATQISLKTSAIKASFDSVTVTAGP